MRIVRQPGFYGLHWDVMWSLSIEEQFYLTYPLLLRWMATRRRAATALVCIAVLGPVSRLLATLIAPDNFLASFTNSFGAFDLLALGALLSIGLDHLQQNPPAIRPGLEIMLGLAGMLGLVSMFLLTSVMDKTDRVWVPSMLGVSLCAFMGVGVRRGWCSSWPFALLRAAGQLSYGSYLLHTAVLFALWQALGRTSVYPAFLAYAAATFLLAALSFRFFEQPAKRAVQRLLQEWA
jgi:peptidoglycan/LPS O-acetylase OafA/YrhL